MVLTMTDSFIKEKNDDVCKFLNEHKDDLIDEIKEEFSKDIEKRSIFNSFKLIVYDNWLSKIITLALIDKCCMNLSVEERLILMDEDDIRKISKQIIKEVYND